MIECVFTLDYEIYGDGTGALKELVYEPAERLREIFRNWDARFVAFVEVAELERIEACGTDPMIDLIKQQIRNLDREGFEIGLHLHPQWSNAHYDHGRWALDFSEYNLCTMPRTKIAEFVGRSLEYLRYAVNRSNFSPLSFRAGSWLFQPTQPAAAILAQNGIKIDSSVFKGGVLHNYNLDYRPALKNGYWWSFDSDVSQVDSEGELIELPIHTELVPFWRVVASKCLGFGNSFGIAGPGYEGRLSRLVDFVRLRYPLKLDFCRMTCNQLTAMLERIVREDQEAPESYKPIVAIGHTKDLRDPHAVDSLLACLRTNRIPVRTFEGVYGRLLAEKGQATASSEMKAHLLTRSAINGQQSSGAGLTYVLITAARDEAAFIGQTIESVVAQAVRPAKWVIVSDGSTDTTDEIVKEYAARHEWIELVRMPERHERHFGGKAHAFNAGYARISRMPHDVVGSLDADISFDEDYFEFLLNKFAEDPQLGVAGTPYEEKSRRYDYRFTSIEHVSGACQLFRTECFKEIGGYVPIKLGGIDLVAVITARMKGWRTRTFLERHCIHHRRIGTASRNTLMSLLHGGYTDYTHGCEAVWQFFRSLYQMTRSPFIVGGTLRLAGYLWAAMTRAQRVVSPELVHFRAVEQRRRLWDFIRSLLGGGKLRAGTVDRQV